MEKDDKNVSTQDVEEKEEKEKLNEKNTHGYPSSIDLGIVADDYGYLF